MTNEAYLRIERVTKRFGAYTALREVSLSVRRGEFMVFLGPSGCGKTTLLRIIAGLETQTGGQVFQDGREISNLPTSKRDFGIVFQSYALFPNLTVRHNVGYGLRSKRLDAKEIDRKVDDLLELIGLPTEGEKYPSQLSGGQQQRVAVARAIATQPGLLLLDEPLSALDARVRVHMRAELKGLQKRFNLTTIMVTHDQAEALTMADRMVVMNKGVIEQIGKPSDVYQGAASRFVADFIGTMNFLPAQVLACGGVRVGAQVFQCEPSVTLRPGAASLAIRAEDVVLANGGGEGPNAFNARVDEIEYNGSFCRTKVSSPRIGGSKLIADIPISAFRAGQIEVGSDVLASLPRDLIRVFPQ